MSTEPTDPNADLVDIRTKWLRFCSHDLGLPYQCICPDEDVRPVIAALVGDVEGLRAEVATLTTERDEARAERSRAVIAVSLLQPAAAERAAMLPVVEAVDRLMVADVDLDEADVDDSNWTEVRTERDLAWDALLDAHNAFVKYAYYATGPVDQMAPSSPPQQPQGDDQGAVAGTDGVEAQEGTQEVPVPRATLYLVARELRSASGHPDGALSKFARHDSRMADGSCCTCAVIDLFELYAIEQAAGDE